MLQYKGSIYLGPVAHIPKAGPAETFRLIIQDTETGNELYVHVACRSVYHAQVFRMLQRLVPVLTEEEKPQQEPQRG
jgi:hypothetical protein